MKLREYRPSDCSSLVELFYNTVHTINLKDYTPIQISVWANGSVDKSAWNKSFLDHNTVIVEEGNTIVGFCDMDNNGYLDRLYVHKDYQRIGIATMLVDELEQKMMLQGVSLFTTLASITAKPFFEHRGYNIIRENKVVRNNIDLINFVMEKNIIK